ncbi:MAG: TrkH family potassium uptake protein [Clostridiales bacterium]|jgi:trk system potassium uptake protein TrkH|nr:TrkH family potassium uptake protein [Clostridiales bacterium]
MNKEKLRDNAERLINSVSAAAGAAARKILRGNVYGKLMILTGVLFFAPAAVVPFYIDEARYIYCFLIPAFGCILLGALSGIFSKPSGDDSGRWQSPVQRGSLPVVFAWLFAVLTGAVPFILGRQLLDADGNLSLMRAVFESASGWTTTGLTLADVENMPRIFLFYRGFMQYCGGLGFIFIVNMVIHGGQEINLFNAEGHPDRVMPNLRKTSRTIFLLYNGFLLAGVLLYCVFGMGLFDAVCHAMSALSTAGFSTRAASIAAYDKIGIEIVTILLMLVGSTNFAVLLLLVKGKFGRVFKISEIKATIIMIVVFSSLITVSLMKSNGLGFFDGVHNAFFGVITTYSTTGYTVADYANWPNFAVLLLFILMLIGGGAGSTAGGIKIIRAHIFLKAAAVGVKSKLVPTNKISPLKYYKAQGRAVIDSGLINETVGFIVSYIGIFLIGSMLVIITSGSDILEGVFEFASALGTVGISNGLTARANDATLAVEAIGMILGRLEIFIVFIAVYSGVSEIKRAAKNKEDRARLNKSPQKKPKAATDTNPGQKKPKAATDTNPEGKASAEQNKKL